MKGAIWALSMLAMTLINSPHHPVQAQERPRDLAEFSLEELLQLEVTSVSKKEQRLSESAAAIYVLTSEDIRRSGATSIPEALRMVPGLGVAQINASAWAITSRGFNFEFADKLLVLIDGRSVYTPLYGGVNWDEQDTLLEDIERIEVIRGPGGTLWGANAVNGIINIITRHAGETQGLLVTGGAGTVERGFGAVRYGGKHGDNLAYRGYVKYLQRGDFKTADGSDAHDAWQVLRGGFRLDWDIAAQHALTFQGDLYNGTADQIASLSALTPPFSRTFIEDREIAGGNLLARWRHALSANSDLRLQVYYDRTERQMTAFRELRQTGDIDFQHRFLLHKRHEIIWGLGYRLTVDDTSGSFAISLNPPSRADHLASAFLQHEITLIDRRLRLTLGTKLELNDYTGLEVQPSGRLLWLPHPQHTVWAAASRAVVTPAIADRAVRFNGPVFHDPGGTTTVVSFFGSTDLSSQQLLAYELGYRVQPTKRVFLDIAAFYNIYDELITTAARTPFLELTPQPPHLVLPQLLVNALHAEAFGVEIAATWNVTERWKLSGGYTWLNIKGIRGIDLAGNDPNNQFHVRSWLNLPGKLEFDSALYYVDAIPNFDIPAYLRLDLRLGWHPVRNLDLSLVLQNLLEDRHREFATISGLQPTEIPRSVYAKVTWRF